MKFVQTRKGLPFSPTCWSYWHPSLTEQVQQTAEHRGMCSKHLLLSSIVQKVSFIGTLKKNSYLPRLKQKSTTENLWRTVYCCDPSQTKVTGRSSCSNNRCLADDNNPPWCSQVTKHRVRRSSTASLCMIHKFHNRQILKLKPNLYQHEESRPDLRHPSDAIK